MTVDQLSIYNGALLMLGERKLADLTEDVEARYVLDNIWDNNGIRRCLEKAFWHHALRTVKISHDPDITTPFGHKYAFTIPDDYIRLWSLCTDEFFTNPVALYQTEGQHFFSDYQDMFMRYVSDGDQYGLNFAMWPDTFTEYVEGYFAVKAIKRLTDAKVDADDLKEDVRKLLVRAKSNDAMKDPTGLTVPSGWSIARSRLDYGRRRQHPYR